MNQLPCYVIPCLLFLGPILAHAAGEDKAKGKGKLEGTWIATIKEEQVKLTLGKGKFTFQLPKGKTIKGSYTTDISKKPMHIDMAIKQGPPDSLGKTALCIYELKGNTLRWCASDPAEGLPRPKMFKQVQGDYLFLTFKRAGKKKDAKGAASEIKGNWKVLSVINDDGEKKDVPKNSRFVISSDKIVIYEGEKKAGTFGYKLDPSKQPKHIDLTFMGEPVLGIYKVEGNKLTICNSGKKGSPRPTAFEPNRELDAGLTVLQRIKD